MILVVDFRVDLGFGPAEDPEGVVRAEEGEGERNGARSRFPS